MSKVTTSGSGFVSIPGVNGSIVVADSGIIVNLYTVSPASSGINIFLKNNPVESIV